MESRRHKQSELQLAGAATACAAASHAVFSLYRLSHSSNKPRALWNSRNRARWPSRRLSAPLTVRCAQAVKRDWKASSWRCRVPRSMRVAMPGEERRKAQLRPAAARDWTLSGAAMPLGGLLQVATGHRGHKRTL